MNNNIIEKKIEKRNGKGIKPVTFVAFTFLILIAIGTILLMLPISNKSGEYFSFTNSLFTATSAVCVTGLVVVNTFANFTMFGQAVILLLIQLGGLGLMTIATLVFIFVGKRITLKERLILQEAYSRDDLQGLVSLTLKIVKYTFIIEGIGVILLAPSFIGDVGLLKGLWQAVFHSVSAFCNAGFDIFGGDSLTLYAGNAYVLTIIMALIVMGGIGFCVIADCAGKGRGKKPLLTHTKIVIWMTAVLILGGAVLYLVFEWNNPQTIADMNLFDKIISSLFQSVTTRTAGFNTIPQADLSSASQVLTNIFMFIGASPGGTGGGIKTTTFFIAFFVILTGAQGKDNIIIFKHNVRIKQAFKAVSITAIGLITVYIVSTIVYTNQAVALISGSVTVPYSSVIFECFSAFGTVGLTHGITGSLSTISLYALIFLMYIGRLGSLFLSVVFAGKGVNAQIKYSDLKIVLG